MCATLQISQAMKPLSLQPRRSATTARLRPIVASEP